MNDQTKGPLYVRRRKIGFEIRTRESEDENSFTVAHTGILNVVDTENEANARLLAASYTCFDKASRALGVDAVELADQLDIAALIRLSAAMLAQFDKLAIDDKLCTAQDMRKVLKALPVIYTPAID